MVESRWSRASVRVRTTGAAVAVVALVLLVGAVALVMLVRGSLRDGLEAAAEQRASEIADEIEASGLPTGAVGESAGRDEADERDDFDELVWQVLDERGQVLRASHRLRSPLPADDTDEVRLDGDGFVVVTEDASTPQGEYVVSVAVSLEEVEDSTAALVVPLTVGLPLVLLVVGGLTWMVATRALAPVERIRSEVQLITGDRLDRRVPVPGSRDEIHRLAETMNQMLGRLQDSRTRQQQFVADASHELRSPLASIRQTAEVARAHPAAMPQGELAEAVLEESARMQRLVEQLLVLARADEAAVRPRQEVDLDDLVLAAAGRVRRERLRVDAARVHPARVHGDESALGQVVRNLVDNAARHAVGRVGLALHVTGARVELVVDDDGAGVPEGERERIFDRFVRLDEARGRDAGGSGLGLAVVEDIVDAHGGAVEVTDSAWGGARFVVRLPAAVDDTDLLA